MSNLLTLKDGYVTEISEKHFSSSGCETCDYGSSYVQDFTIHTSQGRMEFNVSQMYDYAISHNNTFQIFLPNVALIEQMTLAEFFAWVTAEFNREAAKHYNTPEIELRWVKEK